MSQSDDLLRFLLRKNIPVWEAIEILEQIEKKLKEKERDKYEKGRKVYEKAVLSGYETR